MSVSLVHTGATSPQAAGHLIGMLSEFSEGLRNTLNLSFAQIFFFLYEYKQKEQNSGVLHF